MIFPYNLEFVMQVKKYIPKTLRKMVGDMPETECPSCGTKIRLTAKLIVPMTGSLAAGYMIADAPEFFQTENHIIQMYESMNGCMKSADNYRIHRNVCACALRKTYEDFKFFNVKKQFEKNLENCL